jgi:hypothetical protein
MGKITRTLLKDIGELLSRLRTGVFVAIIGVIVGALNWDNLIKATNLWGYISLVLFWLVILIILSIIGELGSRYTGYGFVWLSEWYPNFIYFPKLEISCGVTLNNEIELRVINRKSWQKITLRAEYYCTYIVGTRPGIRGVAPSSVKELLPLASMTGKDARVKVIGKLIDNGITLSTGNKSDEVKFSKPGLYYYEVNLYGMHKGREFDGHGKIALRIKKNNKVECA